MTDAERIALGLTKKLTYRYTFASGDFNFLEKHKNTNYLRALAHLGIYNDSGESFNKKYFTPDSIEKLKQKKDGDDTIKLEKPLYISDFVAPLAQIKRTVIPGGQLFDDKGNELDPPLDLIKDEIIREAETKLTPPGVQLGLVGGNQQEGGQGGTTGGMGETTGQPQGVVVNADDEDEEAATNNDASSGGNAMSGGMASSGGTTASDSTSIREKLNRLLGYKIENGSVVVDKKGKKVMALQKPPLSITGGIDPKIEDDGSISVEGDVTINVDIKGNKGINIIENGKLAIKFSNVKGSFICRSRKLTSLEGCPKTVGGTFDCGDNSITSLSGAPQEVGIFIADKNKSLTSLAGGPKIINGITDAAKSQNTVIYDVSNCGLTTLDNNGITKFGPGGFNCSLNKLTNLNGLGIVASTGVVSFDCSKNELTSLNGIPRPIKDAKSGKPGSYWIRDNVGITLFPVTMADFEVDNFEASGLSLTSLSFAPKKVYGTFNCSGNKGTTKLTNETLGKGRFKVGGGFEDDAGARIVAVDGEFFTSEGTWKDKTYGIDTTYKKPETQASSSPAFAAGTVSGGVVTFKGTGGLIAGQAVYLVEGIRSYTIGYDLNTPNYVSAKAPARGTENEKHGNFLPRQGLNGGKNSYMGGTPSSAGLKEWKGWGEKYKSFINLSFFENYLGGSGTSPGSWGPWSPNGAMIINGKNYGSKADGQFGRPFYYVAGGKSLRSTSGAIFKAKSGSTQSAISTGQGLSSISVGACAASGNWCDANGNYKDAGYSGFTTEPNKKNWPFFGQLTDGTHFAGSTEGTGVHQFGPILSNHFRSKGKQMKILDVGDGGGSAMLAVNGRMIMGGGRPVPIILAWS